MNISTNCHENLTNLTTIVGDKHKNQNKCVNAFFLLQGYVQKFQNKSCSLSTMFTFHSFFGGIVLPEILKDHI